MPTTVVVDTTELVDALRLDRGGWPHLLSWSRQGVIKLVVPEVVVRESSRHYSRQQIAILDKLSTSAGRLDIPTIEDLLDMDSIRAASATSVAEYEGWLREELARHQAEIWELPDVSISMVLDRDLAVKKPFNASGKGYRDTLIWLTLLQRLPLEDAAAMIFLVTENSSDFAVKDGALDPALVEEAHDRGGHVERIRSLDEVVRRLRPEVEDALADYLTAVRETAQTVQKEAVYDAVVAAAERLVGEAIADEKLATPTTGLDLDVPRSFEDPEITSVDADRDSIVIDVYDRYDGETLAMQVSIEAALQIEGFVHKADYYDGLDESIAIFDSDWNEHYVLAAVTREVELQFNVMTVGDEVKQITFDTALPT